MGNGVHVVSNLVAASMRQKGIHSSGRKFWKKIKEGKVKSFAHFVRI